MYADGYSHLSSPLFLPRAIEKQKGPHLRLLAEMGAFGGPIGNPFVFKFEYHVNSNYSDLSTVFYKN
ncbi:hypothetical protein ERG27_04270 [Bacillus amyloliquefaciens]|nr:hypothetical protein BCBMB205_08770 [Bacillus velezensis]APQ49903.1 hypothetical protein BSO20_07410 [Bacillus amyloliquefaciens]QJC41290.1 hypothetical protein FHJ82_04555 [Bacillus sp. HNA3]AQZ74086.1 hypothetical protein BLL65_14200 [Bacillus velezensis]ARZ57208.1 hypothetical protein BAGQ_0972 [Bacillus velezensis]